MAPRSVPQRPDPGGGRGVDWRERGAHGAEETPMSAGQTAATYWATRDRTFPGGMASWANAYRRTRTAHYREVIIAAVARLVPFESVYEVGCHIGTNLLLVRNQWPDARVGGCDVNATALSYAAQALHGPTTVFQTGPAQQSLNWRPRTWGVVLSCYALA